MERAGGVVRVDGDDVRVLELRQRVRFGAQAAGLSALVGTELGIPGIIWPWYVWAFIGIALTAIFGYRRVDLSAKVLTVLVLLEYVIVLIVDVAIIGSGGDSGLNLQPFTPSMIFGSETWAIGILFAFAAFIGFEATTIGLSGKIPSQTMSPCAPPVITLYAALMPAPEPVVPLEPPPVELVLTGPMFPT